ncbi:uncharacterized protein SOCE26_021470 [Sorangium cellulosum]|uniref:VWFC domain-containing protein n=1 Tax=Sorangium cellulosum TaxID=56 RepID=A0A2L0EN77_SORCE|nr:hypothetical protein [Sorangium cellulosum]AUX40746.1 uncharacterized protein SOCE26_021470 [Sorangium cellulosum]
MTAHRLSWSHLGTLLSIAVAAPLALAGCNVTLIGGGDTCEVDGAVYSPGDSFPASDGCNTCTCTEDGTVACTLMECVSSCTYEGVEYPAGASFPASDGCNTCTCDASGSGNVGCTKIACPSCVPGEEFFDGCNTCSCDEAGGLICTDRYCPPGCDYGGVTYAPGDSFPSDDGCNTCTCTADGGVACTERACVCDPESEWWRNYVTEDREICPLIDFVCPENTTHFQSDCGCGCEQDKSCPEFFNCMPPAECDAAALQARCPYSEIAY